VKLPFRGQDKPEKREQIGNWWADQLSALTFGYGRSYSEVDASLGEVCFQSVAYRTAVDLMASLVSELHFDVYTGEGTNRRKLRTPTNLEDPSGDGHGVEDWVYQYIVSMHLRGNVFGDILDQGPTGMLRQVDLFHPDKVSVHLEDGTPQWRVQGRTVPDDRMFHRRTNPVPGNLLGLSPVAAHADTLGLSISATRFGKSWFQDGGHPGGILSNSEADMSDDRVTQKAKDRFMAALFGVREPVVLGRGWKYEQIQVAPEESQFLQTQAFSAAECARIVGAGVAEILGYDTGTSMTYSNTIDRDISLLKYSADRWFKRMERVYGMFLPGNQYAKFDRDSFLDTNVMQKWLVNQKKLSTGAYVINEIRAANHDKPVEWGNEPFAMPTSDDGGEPDPTVAPPGGAKGGNAE
jgi:HK97 family phage portal protein